jgi:putative ATPase
MNLPYLLRPQSLADFIGQDHLVGKGKIIQQMIIEDRIFPMIFWGPPGTGKTTLASIIAHETQADFHSLSAVNAGKEDLRKIIQVANENQIKKIRTILFIDEIHRWNKAQQDSLLPFVESGLILLIGATTENPSFEINGALLSRCRVFILKSLSEENLQKIVQKGVTDTEKGLGKYKKTLSPQAEELLIRLSGGDARVLLNALEMAVTSVKEKIISEKAIQEIFQTKSTSLYDKKAEEHYNTISAFIKSMRGSDVNASLYYLAKMLDGGEDPTFIARRMIIFSSEDIGLADRGALIQANACFEAVHKVGMPEAQLLLAHVVVYLASAKKSRAVANALALAMQAAKDYPNEPIPLHLRNAPTKFMKNIGYGKGYTWSDSYVGPPKNESFLPEKITGKVFYFSEKKE